jgi:two-component system, NtrC family, nitrogen regulation sensor histidine kinase NtrY
MSASRAASAGMGFERRLLLDVSLLLLPLLLLCAFLLWRQPPLDAGHWLLLGFTLLATLVLASRLRHRLVYPLFTLSNLLEALREGDYSLRGSRARRGDAVGDVIWEVNALSQTLRDQRLKVEETSALLAKVIAAIDMAIFSFDDQGVLRLLNPAGQRLLGRPTRDALGRDAVELGLDTALALPEPAVLTHAFGGATGRFDIRRFSFREGGRPHELLVVSDLSRALREEERQAWQRLIRVLGHELNNSLAPIKSMSATLVQLLGREPLPEDWREDAQGGLKVIGDRCEALNRFMIGYATLARLPAPRKQPVGVRRLLQCVAALEQRLPVRIVDGPEIELDADPDQLEQALINLVKNAADAALPEAGSVHIRVGADAERVLIEVIDEGLGLAGSDNLFVPFFTTKPGGSGIGLVLARQIVEGHGGQLWLENRHDRRGCVARMQLPRGGEPGGSDKGSVR